MRLSGRGWKGAGRLGVSSVGWWGERKVGKEPVWFYRLSITRPHSVVMVLSHPGHSSAGPIPQPTAKGSKGSAVRIMALFTFRDLVSNSACFKDPPGIFLFARFFPFV